MTEYSPAKTGEYPISVGYSPIFKTAHSKDNKDNSRHLGRKYARIFFLGHYLFLVAHNFRRASLSENCSLLGTHNVLGQISEHIFAPNGDYCLYIFSPKGGYCLFIKRCYFAFLSNATFVSYTPYSSRYLSLIVTVFPAVA